MLTRAMLLLLACVITSLGVALAGEYEKVVARPESSAADGGEPELPRKPAARARGSK
jgi:hypothetical protein